MIRRTVLEWRSIDYGDGGDEIPEHLADRIAAVAAASPLAGRGGGGVLEHGRRALRARGVVGVIGAEGCALEILPKIDVPEEEGERANASIRRRLIHMLAVALDLRIDVGRLTDLDWQKETLLEVLIRVFTDKLTDAVRQGMPRRYVGEDDDLATLRGRLDVRGQFTRLAVEPQRIACRYDVLSADVALNRIMKAAVTRLGRITRHGETQRRLRELLFTYAEIVDVPPSALPWHEVVLDRTNARWAELINLARLLLGERFQTTSAGGSSGYSLLFEINTLFEAFIARMLARALADTELRVVSQGGRLYCLETEDRRGVFQTIPDILVKRGSEVVQVIDTKWKRIGEKLDDPKLGVSQADVYQMMAYGQLYHCASLTLLYPHHAELARPEGRLARHRITGTDRHLETATIDVALAKDLVPRISEICSSAAAPTPA